MIGSKIYIAGVVSGSAPTATAKQYVFDTNTLQWSTLMDFPRALIAGGGSVRAVELNDGRILYTATQAVGLTITQAATPFWLYDPSSNQAPVEVIVSMPITRFFTGTDILMHVLPNGKVLCIDGANPASGNLLSCVLTISGNTITPSATSDTGFAAYSTTATTLLPTASGSMLAISGVYRVYVDGSGWAAGTQPHAYGTLPFGPKCKRYPGTGWIFVGCPIFANGALLVGVLLTASPAAGALVTQAMKN